MLDIVPNQDLFEGLRHNYLYKKQVYNAALETFKLIKKTIIELCKEYNKRFGSNPERIPFEYHERSELEIDLLFGSDVLFFTLHTNVFEFSRDHEVMKTHYINENKDRSYCGVIMIHNFLADSIKYNRLNDIGYMIGRLFVNYEKHYFIEGKKEIGQLYNNFETSIISPESVRELVESAIRYTVNFDLLTPPFDAVKIVTVDDIQSNVENTRMVTGKRLGFRFQADMQQEI